MKECRKKNKFVVNKLEKHEMVSIDKLLENITNRKVDSNKEKVSWLETHEIKILKSEPFVLYMKTDATKENVQVVDLEKRKKGRQQRSFKDIQLDHLWPTGKPLSKEKIKDLKEILKLVPQDLKHFYNFLRTAEQGEFDDDVDGFGVTNVDFEIDNDDD
ncbi:hypothetical protein J6590_108190 [Homalodisca vitripennis]|nr:hypothetical protein J6590_108190 [Homalodisca vitripennis]